MLNRWVLSRNRKTAKEGAAGKARSPTVDSRVQLTISDEDELEQSR